MAATSYCWVFALHKLFWLKSRCKLDVELQPVVAVYKRMQVEANPLFGFLKAIFHDWF